MGTSKTVATSRIRFGKRTFFFDVLESKNAKKYLRVTQSEFVEEGKPHKYSSFVLFPDNVQEFQKVMTNALSSL